MPNTPALSLDVIRLTDYITNIGRCAGDAAAQVNIHFALALHHRCSVLDRRALRGRHGNNPAVL